MHAGVTDNNDIAIRKTYLSLQKEKFEIEATLKT